MEMGNNYEDMTVSKGLEITPNHITVLHLCHEWRLGCPSIRDGRGCMDIVGVEETMESVQSS